MSQLDEPNLALDVDWEGPEEARIHVVRVCVLRSNAVTRDGARVTISDNCTSIRSFEKELARLNEELQEISAQAQEYFGGERPKAKSKAKSAPKSETPARPSADLVVRDAMTREVKTVERNASLSLAEELMQKERFRHVIVLDEDDKLAGIISHRDIFYGALSWSMGHGKRERDTALESFPVKQVMQTNVVSVDPEMPLAEAAGLMIETKIGCLPVLDGDELVGILTETDFLGLLTRA